MKRYLTILILVALSINLFGVERYAIVMGNSSYSNAPLKNTENDAYDVSTTFNDLGYTVYTLIDGNRQEMEELITETSYSLPEESMIVFYYAGHAAQVDGVNYLIPVDESIVNENDVKYKSVNLDWVVETFKDSLCKTDVIILDSCRDNPFYSSIRSSTARGLTITSVPKTSDVKLKNTAIIYATSEGNIAYDGDGRNSPFTAAFLKYVGMNNETILDIMTYVSQDVFTTSEGAQEPTVTNALKEKIYFKDFEEVIYIEQKGVLSLYSASYSEVYINGDYIFALSQDETRNISNLETGFYDIEFVSDDYKELYQIELLEGETKYINFDYTTPLYSDKIISIKREIANLESRIGSLEKQKAVLERNRPDEKTQKKRAMNAGLLSVISYAATGFLGYSAYENYRYYNDATLTSDAEKYRDISQGFLIAAGGTALLGIISSSVSSAASDSLNRYNIDLEIINTQIDEAEKELRSFESELEFYESAN